jgi:hypothetical protein
MYQGMKDSSAFYLNNYSNLKDEKLKTSVFNKIILSSLLLFSISSSKYFIKYKRKLKISDILDTM